MSLDAFAAMAIADRRPYFEAAAERRDTLAVIIEKDFWVVWTLKHLSTSKAVESVDGRSASYASPVARYTKTGVSSVFNYR